MSEQQTEQQQQQQAPAAEKKRAPRKPKAAPAMPPVVENDAAADPGAPEADAGPSDAGPSDAGPSDAAPGAQAETEQQPPAERQAHPVQLAVEAISERVKDCMAQLKETDAMLRSLTKDVKKLCKKRASSGKPGNFTQPLPISEELAETIGADKDARMTRGAVTKAINEYAVAAGLKLPNNGRIIKLDDKLARLFGKSVGDEIPIINVQSHLKEHYGVAAPAEPAAAQAL